MLHKINETEFRDQWEKYYVNDQKYDCLKTIQMLTLDDNSRINVYENEDVGFKTVAGRYTLEEFIENYPQIKSSDIEQICLHTEYYGLPIMVRLQLNSTEISLLTPERDLELTDVLKKNENERQKNHQYGK